MHADLTQLGLIDDDEIVLDEAALTLASQDHPETELAPYNDLLAKAAARLSIVGAGVVNSSDQARSLSHVLRGEFGFFGDSNTYDDPDNADLIRVIDRRRGLPVSLSILYVSAARRLGWTANVLDVPGHLLVLVGQEASPVIVDPFAGGAFVQREQLAALLTRSHYKTPTMLRHIVTMPNRAVLIRLMANQAMRAEQAGRGRRALKVYGRMTMIAPGDGQAWWQLARLQQIDGDVPAARSSLTAMLEITREPRLRQIILNALDRVSAP